MAHTKYHNKSGQTVPSVTTIIGNNLGWNKQMLIAWSKKIALTEGRDSDEIVEEAADIGTLTHYLCECKIKRMTPDISSYPKEQLIKARNGYYAFCDWESEWRPTRYVHNEIKLVSEKYNYGGTIDLVVEKDGHLHILDIKTSNHIHPEMVIQLAAYKNLFDENNPGSPIKSMGIIKLHKEERKYKSFPVSGELYKAGWEVFLNLLDIQKNKSLLNDFGR